MTHIEVWGEPCVTKSVPAPLPKWQHKSIFEIIFTVMLSLLVGTECVLAQDPGPINTERPSFSSSPLALAAGFWQIEAGYEYTRNLGSNSSKEQTLRNALLRFGFHPGFELQLNWAGYNRLTSPGSKTTGLKDASLGVKWQISADDTPFVAGVFAGVTLPVGDKDLTSDEYDPEFAVFWT